MRNMQADWQSWRRTLALDDGTTVSYVDVGSGPTTVFIHGIFVSNYLWRHVIDGARTSRRCIAIDLLNHGRTFAGPDASFSMTTQAELVVALVDALGIEQFDLVGTDTGGGISQVIAARHPDRLRSLLLTNCDVHDNWPPEALKNLHAMAEAGALADVIAAVSNDHDFARSEDAFGIGYQHPERLTDDAIEEYVGDIAKHPDRIRLLEQFLNAPDVSELTSLEPALSQLTVPTTVAWGTADVFFDIQWAHWLRDTIPGCDRVVEIEGAKLFLPDDRSDQLLAILQEHWAASPAA